MRVDECGDCIDHCFEGCVGLVGSHCDALELFEFAEEVLDQVTTFVEVRVDDQRFAASWVLRNTDQRPAFVHLRDDPVAVEGLVGQHRIEADAVDQGGHAGRVETVPRQQDEAHEVAQSIRQRQNFGGPAALRLAYRLTLSPPFEPCPWR